MKLDKDLFTDSMNTVEFDKKKVLVRPSQAKSTKVEEILIEEERQLRMIRPKNLEIG
jgi:hypothetical protein